jgi:uncharacterized protein (TIGR00369 family)
MSQTTVTHQIHYEAPFDAEFIEGLRQLVEEKITFNQVIGLKLTSVSASVLTARIHMRPELVGHFSYNRLHGGVTSAALDTLGGLACLVNVTSKHMDEPPEQRLARFLKVGTIDLRVDYMGPAIGEFFDVRAEALRVGSRIGYTQMGLRGPQGELLSTGSGAYIVS